MQKRKTAKDSPPWWRLTRGVGSISPGLSGLSAVQLALRLASSKVLFQPRVFHQSSDLLEFRLNSGQVAGREVVAVPANRTHARNDPLHVGAEAWPFLRPAGLLNHLRLDGEGGHISDSKSKNI